MEYEQIKQGLMAAIPFNRHVGLDYLEVGHGTATVKLSDRPEVRNHVGSLHAGALFSAGEAASGGAFAGAFGERMADLTALAERAEIAYSKIARGEIIVVGRFGEDVDALMVKVEEERRARFPVDVDFRNGAGESVASMTVHWYVRRNDD
jgi:acyl-coenzyme A thioesterase PaaI-like protein